MNQSLKLVYFIFPFAVLSALSVTKLFGSIPLMEIGLDRFFLADGIFIPGVLFPGLFFGIGLGIYLRKHKQLNVYNYIFSTTAAYIVAYTIAYFVGVFTGGLISPAIAVFLGTLIVLRDFSKQIQTIPPAKRLQILLTVTIIFGIASYLAPYIERIFITYLSYLYYNPNNALTSYFNESVTGAIPNDSIVGAMIFGMVLPGTQILVLLWQLGIAWVLGKELDKVGKPV